MSVRTAFVLGGGGVLGAAEVGMLRALPCAAGSARSPRAGPGPSDPGPLRRLLTENLVITDIEDLHVQFACVAASIERAAEHWFTADPIVPAVLASCALPGLYPPVQVDAKHFLDGGLGRFDPVGPGPQAGR